MKLNKEDIKELRDKVKGLLNDIPEGKRIELDPLELLGGAIERGYLTECTVNGKKNTIRGRSKRNYIKITC